MSMLFRIIPVLALVTSLNAQTGPWPAEVPGFQEPEPGEHPRLFFRKSDIPALRARMNTPEGRAILQRLLTLLGNNGWQMPDVYNEYFPVNIKARGQIGAHHMLDGNTLRERKKTELPLGAFTIGHPPGYGFLYILTGKQRYADLARQSLEIMFDKDRYSVTGDAIRKVRGELFQVSKSPRWKGKDPKDVVTTYGQPDRDERYTWTRPGAGLRTGAMMLCVAMAYDFCYDAWPEDFRRRVVDEIQNYDVLPVDYDKFAEGRKGRLTMDKIVNTSFPARSNHFGAYIGGSGVALLAIRNDPGADRKRINRWLDTIEKQVIRNLTQGFGDKGFFAEGHGPSHMSANNAFVPLLQAARVSWGKDFISPRSNAPWLTLRWAMEIIPGEKAWYPNYKINAYGTDHKIRGPMSEGGDWSQGFGALRNDDEKAAMLWTYLKAIEKERPLELFDAWTYPHRAVFAFINWPIGMTPKNPAEVLGHGNADSVVGHFMFRKMWQDENDVYATFFLNHPKRRGYVRSSSGNRFTVWGHGMRFNAGLDGKKLSGTKNLESYSFEEDGSGVVAFSVEGDHHSVAVDFGPESGAEAVLVIGNAWAGPAPFVEKSLSKANQQSSSHTLHTAYYPGGSTPFYVVVLHRKGKAPDIRPEGDTLHVGRQSYHFDGKTLHFKL